MNEKLMQLFQNKDFAEKAASLETVEEVLAKVKDAGVATTREEFDSFMDYLERTNNMDATELTEHELEKVAGGEFFTAAAIVSGIVAIVGAAKWYFYDEPYNRGKSDARKYNNQRKNKLC